MIANSPSWYGTRHLLFYFILILLMSSYNQHCLGIFIVVSFRIFIIIILLRRWFINYFQGQIFILRGVLDEVDEIISELPGGEGFSIIVIIPHGRISDGHPSPIPYFFSLKISMFDGIDYTIIIILAYSHP